MHYCIICMHYFVINEECHSLSPMSSVIWSQVYIHCTKCILCSIFFPTSDLLHIKPTGGSVVDWTSLSELISVSVCPSAEPVQAECGCVQWKGRRRALWGDEHGGAVVSLTRRHAVQHQRPGQWPLPPGQLCWGEYGRLVVQQVSYSAGMF